MIIQWVHSNTWTKNIYGYYSSCILPISMYIINHSMTATSSFDKFITTSENSYSTKIIPSITMYGYKWENNTLKANESSGNALILGYI